MEEMVITQMREETNADESGVVEPNVMEEHDQEMQMISEEDSTEAWENVSAVPPDEAMDGQQAETVTEPCNGAETSQTIGLLQAEYDALSKAFPGELPFTHLADMPRLGAFLTLREKGLSSREAYLAIEGERTGATRDVAHLRAAAPRVAVPTAPALLSRETLAEWRRLFPHLSDREIGDLYRRTATNET